ncbi:hypothetical protein, partial [Pseudomonas sp. HY2-MNA-CIBAN-0224]|uniref:hypothetical protein n=1 Tax=Pseudomonas sp. HY2-MNA-CIBAN-0224 TaxID=3140471 RepID=UPI0033254985
MWRTQYWQGAIIVPLLYEDNVDMGQAVRYKEDPAWEDQKIARQARSYRLNCPQKLDTHPTFWVFNMNKYTEQFKLTAI